MLGLLTSVQPLDEDLPLDDDLRSSAREALILHLSGGIIFSIQIRYQHGRSGERVSATDHASGILAMYF